MNKVLYRDLEKRDYESIKKMINEAFGFYEFIKDTKFLDTLLNMYLQNCILSSSYSKVAVKDNKVVGIILGSAHDDKKSLRKINNIFIALSNGLKLLFANKENKKSVKDFAKISQIYKEIIKGKEKDFQGCIELFIVSKEARGLGIGKALINHVACYMKTLDVKNIYLYTDTRCNYGFYDSQNFIRLSEKEVFFNTKQYKLNIFLYGYKV